MVKRFCYLSDWLNAGGSSEAAMTARTRNEWVKFRKCSEKLYDKCFSLRLNGKVYQRCVQPPILHGSETWCLNDREVAVLRKTKRAMISAMSGVKLMTEKASVN